MTRINELRAFALEPVSVQLPVSRWRSAALRICGVATIFCTALSIYMFEGWRATLARDLREPSAPRAVAFDGYPLIGPGMTCWFKDVRRDGEVIVHDLCERFLDAYRRYHR